MKKQNSYKLSHFPINIVGKIISYDDDKQEMPRKIIEMGLLPETSFIILRQAPFSGPLYIEFGIEKSKIALRKEEADYILVERI